MRYSSSKPHINQVKKTDSKFPRFPLCDQEDRFEHNTTGIFASFKAKYTGIILIPSGRVPTIKTTGAGFAIFYP